MNLVKVISMEFLMENSLRLFDIASIFPYTGSNNAVLEPPIGSFGFSFGLRREGVSDFNIAVLQDLFPLRGGFIGQKIVFSPDGVSSLDKAEN